MEKYAVAACTSSRHVKLFCILEPEHTTADTIYEIDADTKIIIVFKPWYVGFYGYNPHYGLTKMLSGTAKQILYEVKKCTYN